MAESFFDRVHKNDVLHSPDVLSCLANLSNDEVFTPPEVVNQMLDMLPQELFSDPNTRFLDPACKTGVFLREIAKRLLIGLEPIIPDLQERIDHIFHNQLYGIAITELTSLLSRRSLYCSKYPNGEYSVCRFDSSEGNIRYKRILHTWGKDKKCIFCGTSQEGELGEDERGQALETHAYELIHTVNPEEIFKMKFDVVISNPPYQLNTARNDSDAQAKPIYHHFINQAIKLDPRFLVMITPSRWFAGGWGLDDFRDRMMTSNHIKEIHDFPESKDCFAGVGIAGGVSYFLYDKLYKGKCLFVEHSGQEIRKEERFLKEKNCDVVIRFGTLVDIYHKVLKKEKDFIPFSSIVSGRSPFGFNTNHVGDERKLSRNHIPYLQNKGNYLWMDKTKITRNQEAVDKPKVFISKAYGLPFPFPSQIINKPIVGKAGQICSGTYLLIGPFKSDKEAENVARYLKTKFVRALVLINKVSQDAYSKIYNCVPILDFNTEWTDADLYDRYGLTNDEISFIENAIKPMEEQ